jgi:4-carboxymuconolactone decarboxylase
LNPYSTDAIDDVKSMEVRVSRHLGNGPLEQRGGTMGTKFKDGSTIRRELLGDEQVRLRDEGVYANDVMREFVEVTNVTIFEKIWGRPGLDFKTRCLITVVSDVANGRMPELDTHIRMCLRQGWTKDEVKEAILHLLAYVGAPLVRSSLVVAVKVFEQTSGK